MASAHCRYTVTCNECSGWLIVMALFYLNASGLIMSYYAVIPVPDRAPVAQLVEHWAAMRKVVSSTLAGPTLRVFK